MGEDFVTYDVPSKERIERYRREVMREKRKEEGKKNYRRFLGTWMVVVCPERHFSAVPFATRFHCQQCDRDFTVRVLLPEKEKTPNPKQYWFKGNWRGMDGYWFQKNWKKAMVFEKGLSEEEAIQLVQKLERGEDYDSR